MAGHPTGSMPARRQPSSSTPAEPSRRGGGRVRRTRKRREGAQARWRSFYLLLVSLLMLLIDVTIVTVAVPSIQQDLHASYGQVELVLSIYQVGFAVLLITGGRLGDIYGRKRVLNWGTIGFMASSAACGFSPGTTVLIAGRFVQGAFAALMYPQIFAYAHVLFPGEERRRAFATLGAAVGLGVVIGPVLGGILLQLNLAGLTWRPIFLVNLFVGGFALVAGHRRLQESREDNPSPLDVSGAVVAAIWLFLLVWPVTVGPQDHWPLSLKLMLAAFVPVLAIFLWMEWRRRAQGPLLDFRLLRDRAFQAGLASDFFCYLALPSFVFLFFVVVQVGLGFSALRAGLTLLPYAFGELSGAVLSGRWVRTLGKRVLYIGLAGILAGTLLLMYTLNVAGPRTDSWRLLPGLLLLGFGWGVTISPLINIVLASVKSGETGSGSGVLTTVQRVGGALGIGAAAMVFFAVLGAQAAPALHATEPVLKSRLSAAGLSPLGTLALTNDFDQCFLERLHSNDPNQPTPACRAYLADPGRSDPARPSAFDVQPPLPPTLRQDLQAADRTASATNYAHAFAEALWFQVVMFAIALLLVVRMPPPDPKKIGA